MTKCVLYIVNAVLIEVFPVLDSCLNMAEKIVLRALVYSEAEI